MKILALITNRAVAGRMLVQRLQFSADGKTVSFGALVGREAIWKTVDVPK